METNNIELLDAYLGGTLTPEQQLQIEARLKTDDAFKEDYRMYQLMLSAITENRKAELKTYIGKNVKVKPAPFFRTPTFYVAAAASVVLCLVSYFVVYKQLNEQSQLAKQESKETKKENSNTSKEDSAKPVNDQNTAKYEPQQYEVPKIEAEEQSIVALDDKDAIENKSGGTSNTNNDAVAANPEDVKVESDKMVSDTFLFIPRKIYIQKPKQYQTNSNDLYTVITTGDKRNLEVQFWRSPINYSGYKLNKNLLVIYGNFDASQASFQELKDVIYMKYKNDYYKISLNETYTGMKKETDPKIIADLEIKK